MGLDKNQLVGQGLDGASNMSGCNAGLCTLIQQHLSPKAIYIHCYAHRLNLALEAACCKISSVDEMIKTAQNLYAYVEGSAKRHHLFAHIQDPSIQTTLKELCRTRWHHRYNSFKAIKKSFPSLLTFLSIQDEETTAACSTSASALLAKIQNVSFVLHLVLMKKCFKVTNHLSEFMQKVDIDIMSAQKLYKCAVSTLTTMKSYEAYLKYYKKVMAIVELNGIEADTKHGKKRGRKNSIEMSKEEEYKVKYLLIIDTLIGELQFRFKEENIRRLVMIHKIITNVEWDKSFDIREELKLYEADIDFDRLGMDLLVWYEYKKQNPQQFNVTNFAFAQRAIYKR